MSQSTRSSRSLFRGLGWVLVANATYLGGAAVLTLILPRFIDPFEFGLWQLYQLFALYLGYVTLGYTDGLNLRLAGRRAGEVPRREVSGGLTSLLLIDAFLFAAMAGIFALRSSAEAATLMVWAALGAACYVPRTALSVVFQSTGSARRYSLSLVIERVVLVVGVLLLLAFGQRSALTLVVADVAAKAAGLMVSAWLGRRFLTCALRPVSGWWRPFFTDCRNGLYVLFANFAAMLISGAVRLLVIGSWGVVVFGQVSLAFQLASLFMVAINAIAISLLPNLKKVPEIEYVQTYQWLRRRLVTPLVVSLLLCFPVLSIIAWWLPDYAQAIQIAALIFPLYIYETMNRGLTAVFMKALRIERLLLWVNLVALAAAVGIALVGTRLLDSLQVTVIGVVVALALRALLSELVLARRIGIPVFQNWIAESTVVVAFIGCNLLGAPPWAVVVVFMFTAIYVASRFTAGLGRSRRLAIDVE